MAYAKIANIFAFLRMIRWAEGTHGPDGYRTLFGGNHFESYSDHPRVLVRRTMGGKEYASTAAGAYQFLSRTWDHLVKQLKLPDFSPESQIQGAIKLLDECGALFYLEKDKFEDAVRKANTVWASLPGSPYGQPVKTLEDCKRVYVNSGGKYVTSV